MALCASLLSRKLRRFSSFGLSAPSTLVAGHAVVVVVLPEIVVVVVTSPAEVVVEDATLVVVVTPGPVDVDVEAGTVVKIVVEPEVVVVVLPLAFLPDTRVMGVMGYLLPVSSTVNEPSAR